MSNSNTEMWSLQVRSIVDLSAMDSIPSSNACTLCSCSLKLFHCIIHLQQHIFVLFSNTTRDAWGVLKQNKQTTKKQPPKKENKNPHTCCQMKFSRSCPPLPWTTCKCHREKFPLETRPSSPRVCD